jgi:hypothetical protein
METPQFFPLGEGLERFAHGVEQDKAAVQAGFTLPIKNGQGRAMS